MLDFRSAARKQPIVTGIMRSLDDAEIGALAAYYATLPASPRSATAPAQARSAQSTASPQRPTAGSPPSASDPSQKDGDVTAPSTSGSSQRDEDVAVRLDTVGDGARALPACANCHGARGAGAGELLPRLAGQPSAYIETQLRAMREGSRANDDGGVMRAFASRLTEAEIQALARYYAAGGRDAASRPQASGSLPAAQSRAVASGSSSPRHQAADGPSPTPPS